MAPAAAVKAGVSGITTPSGSHVSSVIEIASDPVKKDVIKKSGEGDVVSAAPSVTATLARDNDAGVFATKETIADQMTRVRVRDVLREHHEDEETTQRLTSASTTQHEFVLLFGATAALWRARPKYRVP